ncbi:MAG TPA: thioredoxin-disulfide reductase [Spirochaetota bacterium]|nr:thioredoxin-disulfide reductase [Spirochaetota bacterium]HOS56168.1 thioredoxin-disulfide reductase [Spirochaetota bacterium]HPK63091.1 thioredoxin-disulfide reductase [Spirochaetota bacterium]HQF78589.1 thioredoxin-disulfide reductase [Spirochaetota bacterium]HQH29855.1 thioredoxin-disulfide reductase [Spirochaetota bacterium]
MYDIIIIGAGPAGLTAGIYSCRAGYKTLIVEKLNAGGQIMLTDAIDNYPGFPEGITGFELQDRLKKQADKFGAEFVYGEASKIDKTGDILTITCEGKKYETKAAIITTGASHRKLGVKGEKEFSSKGVSYCGTCDGPFFRDKNVVIVGGGDTALTEAIFLARLAKSVAVVHRRDRFRAVESLIKQAESISNISFIYNSTLEEIKGDASVKSVVLKNTLTNNIQEINVDGVFIFVGLDPNTNFLDKSIKDEKGYVVIDKDMKTAIKGLYAAGDVRADAYRQIVCACGDGAKAAKFAMEYVDELSGNAY